MSAQGMPLSDMKGPEESEIAKLLHVHGNDLDFIHFQSYEPYEKYQQKYGDLVHYKISTLGDQVLVSNPKDVKSIYESPDFNARPADRVAYIGYLSGLIAGKKNGEFAYGVVNDNTARWAQKRYLHDKFVVDTYPNYIPFMNEHAKKLVAQIKAIINGKPTCEIKDFSFLRRWTFEMICEAYLGKEDFNHDPALKEKLFNAQSYWLDNFHWYAPIQGPAKGTWNIPARLAALKFDHELAPVTEFFNLMYKLKKDRQFKGNDWMSIMGREKTPDGSHLTEEELKTCTWDLIIGCIGPLPFVIEFGMYVLGQKPFVQEKVTLEDKGHFKGKASSDFSIVDIHALTYLHGTTQETLRMYPASGAVNMRTATTDVQFEGYHVPKGTTMIVNTQHINRDPRVWTEPNNIDPLRWTDRAEALDKETAKKPEGNLAFGGGARFCPGRDFSAMLCNVLWGHILRNFKLEYKGDKQIEPLVYMELISRVPKDALAIEFTTKP